MVSGKSVSTEYHPAWYKCHYRQVTQALPQGVTKVIKVHAIILGDLMGHVWKKRNFEASQSTFLPWCLCPGQVSEMWIHRACYHLRVQCKKFLQPIVECYDLRRTNECAANIQGIRLSSYDFFKVNSLLLPQEPAMNIQIQRIEEKYNIFSKVVCKPELLDLSLDYGCSLPVWRRLGNCKNEVTSTYRPQEDEPNIGHATYWRPWSSWGSVQMSCQCPQGKLIRQHTVCKSPGWILR